MTRITAICAQTPRRRATGSAGRRLPFQPRKGASRRTARTPSAQRQRDLQVFAYLVEAAKLLDIRVRRGLDKVFAELEAELEEKATSGSPRN